MTGRAQYRRVAPGIDFYIRGTTPKPVFPLRIDFPDLTDTDPSPESVFPPGYALPVDFPSRWWKPNALTVLDEQAKLEREARWPDAGRLQIAFRLAVDVEACADLLAGRPVDPARLDPLQRAKAQEARLVQLVRPIDLVNIDNPEAA